MNNLPWRVWTGAGWEKQVKKLSNAPKSASDLENGDPDAEMERYDVQECPPSTSHPHGETDDESTMPPWFDSQTECAICLNDFVKGDRVRLLPCKHIFHMAEVDEWLIHRKKLVSMIHYLLCTEEEPGTLIFNQTQTSWVLTDRSFVQIVPCLQSRCNSAIESISTY